MNELLFMTLLICFIKLYGYINRLSWNTITVSAQCFHMVIKIYL